MAGVAVALAAIGAGAVGASLARTPAATGGVVVPPVNNIVVVDSGLPSRPKLVLPPAPGLPAATGTVLFSSDFQAGNTNNWHATLLPSSDSAASWLVKEGAVEMAGDVNLVEQTDEAYLLAGDAGWHDLTLEANVLAGNAEGAGLIWNATTNGFYRVQVLANLPNNAPKVVLELVRDSGTTTLATAPAAAYKGYTINSWITLRVTSTAGRQQVWVDGAPVLDVSDATLAAGQVGLFAYADSHTRFDNVRVSAGR
jgi:hypothetical protein